ncbi:MAG: hypothetical protein ACRDJE_19910, partial [Dehalococcoidia bacterium]
VQKVPRVVWRASYDEAAEKLIGLVDASQTERVEAALLARAIFVPEGDGVVHRYEGQVAVIRWPGRAGVR